MRLFYTNPNRSFYVREITRKIDEQINSVRRELANLLSVGIITSDTTNNKLYYEVNQDYDFYKPLLAIFGQGDDEAEPLAKKAQSKQQASPSASSASERDKIKKLGNVEIALYTGQFTRDESSGVDMLIVGDINQHSLHKFISELEAQEGKEIRYAIFSYDEFDYRRKIKDRFIDTVMNAKKQILVDKNSILQ